MLRAISNPLTSNANFAEIEWLATHAAPGHKTSAEFVVATTKTLEQRISFLLGVASRIQKHKLWHCCALCGTRTRAGIKLHALRAEPQQSQAHKPAYLVLKCSLLR